MTTREEWDAARSGDASARERIIVEHYEFVKRVAGKMGRSLPQHVDRQDLTSYGVIGLIRAIAHYDPNAGVDFETYAAPSVRSVILDELRKEDWAPRSLRKSSRELSRAEEAFRKEQGRDPTDAEAAAALGWETKKVADTKRRAEASYHKSLDEGDTDREWASPGGDPDSEDQTEAKGARHAMLIAMDEIRSMPPLDQAVLALYYYHGHKLAGVGRELGITETKASQVHGRAVTRLSEVLRGLLGGDQEH